MATLLKTDGTEVENVDISTLKKMQSLVGGYIEIVYLKSGEVLIVNEEGLLFNLPQNPKASEMGSRMLVGDVILAGSKEIN